MADVDDIFDWTLQREGGLSRSKYDSASKYPAPYEYTSGGVTASDWHTNKGVTWETFESLGSSLGYSVTSKNFFSMPDEIWYKISKKGYWDKFNLDELPSQSLANLIFQSAYGSGTQGALNMWNKYFGTHFTKPYELTSYVYKQAKKIGSKKLFKKMWTYRLNWLLSLPGQEANYKGWKNRAVSLYELSLGTTPSNVNGTSSKSLFSDMPVSEIVLSAGLFYLAFQVGKKL